MRLEKSLEMNTSTVFYHTNGIETNIENLVSFNPHQTDWEQYPDGLAILIQKQIRTNKVVGQQDLWVSEPGFSTWVPPLSFINSIMSDTKDLIIQDKMGNPQRPGSKLSTRILAENPEEHFNLADTNFEWLVYEEGMSNDRTLFIPGINNIQIDGWVAYPEYESNLLHEIEYGTGVSGLATGIDSASLNSIRYCINKYIGQLAQTRMLKDGKTRLTQQHNFNAVSLHSQLTNEINQAIDRFNSKDSSSTQATSLDIESSLYNLE